MYFTSGLRISVCLWCYVIVFDSLTSLCFGQSNREETTEEPPGHNQPFGSHTQASDVQVLQEFPQPQVFFEEYLQKSRPFIVKSVLNATTFPAYTKWTDDFFRAELGQEVVDAEPAKKEIRTMKPRTMTISDFLEVYKIQELYMVQGIEDFSSREKRDLLLKDVHLPRSLLCGGLQNSVESLVMWFSSGGTKSVLHSDDYENFNCVLDGNKQLVFVDKKYKEQIEETGFHEEGSYSDIDVDKVDMRRYPRIQEVPVQEALLTKGDCLYIPYGWYHQVNSPGGRSLALNFWFLPLTTFNTTDCKNKEFKHQTEPFTKYGIGSPIHLAWLKFTYEFRDRTVAKSDFDDVIMHQLQEISHVKDKIFEYIDKDGSGTLTQSEIRAVDPEAIAEEFPVILSAHLRDSVLPELDPGPLSDHDEL